MSLRGNDDYYTYIRNNCKGILQNDINILVKEIEKINKEKLNFSIINIDKITDSNVDEQLKILKIRKVGVPTHDHFRKRIRIYINYEKGYHRRSKASFARHLIELLTGITLPPYIEVDHKDNDNYNDHVSNLQVLTKSEHSKKSMLDRYGDNMHVLFTFICPICEKKITKYRKHLQSNWNKGRSGPGCNKKCGQKINNIPSLNKGKYQAKDYEEGRDIIGELIEAGGKLDGVKLTLSEEDIQKLKGMRDFNKSLQDHITFLENRDRYLKIYKNDFSNHLLPKMKVIALKAFYTRDKRPIERIIPYFDNLVKEAEYDDNQKLLFIYTELGINPTTVGLAKQLEKYVKDNLS